MAATEEHVRLRKPCPCGHGEVIMSFHLPTREGDPGYFGVPHIACGQCAPVYEASYHSQPDRAELVPRSGSSANAVVTYRVEPVCHEPAGAVAHA